MCLAVPAKLSQCQNGEALADLHGNHVHVSTILLPDSKDGDWVLVHAGFAIQRLDEQEAQATWAILQDMQKAQAAQMPEGKP